MSSQGSTFWKSQRVVVTGGAGFLGSFVVEELRRNAPASIVVPRSVDIDLRKERAILKLLDEAKPTMIIHLAAVCGGIGANQQEPGRFFYDNAMMGIQLMEQARLAGVQKFVQVGTVCSYPKMVPTPFREDHLWDGYPEETNAPYGLAKKMLLVQAQAYRQQYGFNVIYLMPANLYGPRDNFDLQTSHVIPAMIRKFLTAKETGGEVSLWGTGTPSREFLYAKDAAEGIVLAAERYNSGAPCNLGTHQEISIKLLAEHIADLCGYMGKIHWDATLPDGQPRRQLDVSRAEKEFGFKASTRLLEGLRQTIEWYQQSIHQNAVSTDKGSRA